MMYFEASDLGLCCLPNEPPPDKTNKMTVHPAKTQISLGVCPIWSESSLCAQRVAKDPSFLHADWVRVFAGRTCHFVGFVMRRLQCKFNGIPRMQVKLLFQENRLVGSCVKTKGPWQQIKMRNLQRIFMLCGGLHNKHFYKSSVKIPAMRQQLEPIFIFPILSSMETLSCHSNKSTT